MEESEHLPDAGGRAAQHEDLPGAHAHAGGRAVHGGAELYGIGVDMALDLALLAGHLLGVDGTTVQRRVAADMRRVEMSATERDAYMRGLAAAFLSLADCRGLNFAATRRGETPHNGGAGSDAKKNSDDSKGSYSMAGPARDGARTTTL
jgi:hypothetical protein